MKNNKRIFFIMTCLIFMIGNTSLLGTKSFNRELNTFVTVNNISQEEINVLIGKINKIDSLSKNQLKKELIKISKLKNRNNLSDDSNFFADFSTDFYVENVKSKNSYLNNYLLNENIIVNKNNKNLENNLRMRE